MYNDSNVDRVMVLPVMALPVMVLPAWHGLAWHGLALHGPSTPDAKHLKQLSPKLLQHSQVLDLHQRAMLAEIFPEP